MGEDKIFSKFPNLPKMVVDFIKSLVAMLKSKDDELKMKDNELKMKDDELKALRAENQKLKEKLSLDSHNSSKPPSSDPPEKKTKPKSTRQPSGKKPGGQPNHKGHGIKHLQTREPDRVVEHWPATCEACSNRDKCAAKGKVADTQYGYDIVFVPVFIKNSVMSCCCPLKDGEKLVGTAPLASTHEYGKGLYAFCSLLYSYGEVSYSRIKELIEGLFGFSISTATVYKAVQSCKKGLESTIEWIKEQLIDSPLLHVDETGFKVKGKNHWVHGITNELLTHLSVQERRGYEGMINAGILEHFKGNAIHDFWPSYFKFAEMIHSLCNVHILRELIERWENTKQEWPKKMLELLLRIKKTKEEIIEKGGNAFNEDQWAKLKEEYDLIVAEGLALNPPPVPNPKKRGRPARGKTLCLLDRFRNYHEEILRFATDFSVPFDNNPAERIMRNVKTRQKISGSMRNIDGAQAYCDIMSYLLSTRPYNINAFDAIMHVFNGTSQELLKKHYSKSNPDGLDQQPRLDSA